MDQFDVPRGANINHFAIQYLCAISIIYVSMTWPNLVNDYLAQSIYRQSLQDHLIMCKCCFKVTMTCASYCHWDAKECILDDVTLHEWSWTRFDSENTSDHLTAIKMQRKTFTLFDVFEEIKHARLQTIRIRDVCYGLTDGCPMLNAACSDYQMPCNMKTIARNVQPTYDQLLYDMEARQLWITLTLCLVYLNVHAMICAIRMFRSYRAILKIEINNARMEKTTNEFIELINSIIKHQGSYDDNSTSQLVDLCGHIEESMAIHQILRNRAKKMPLYDYYRFDSQIVQLQEISVDHVGLMDSHFEKFMKVVDQNCTNKLNQLSV